MTRYLEQLNECTDPTTGDFLPIYDASAGSTDKDRKVNISRFAILANAQTFTALQTFAPTSTSVNAITMNMPSSTTGYAWEAKYNGTSLGYYKTNATVNQITLSALDCGSSFGPYVEILRNSNASTPSAGWLRISNKDGTAYNVWPDASGNLRIASAVFPTNANDTSGSSTVIGTQTSMAAAKNISDELPDLHESLLHIVQAAKTGLRAWNYKSGAYNGEQFPIGIITDYAPRFGMDRDEDHPAGKSLNIPVAIGDLFAAIAIIAEHLGLDKELPNGKRN